MWEPDYYLRYVEFPASVKGVPIPNNDGTYDIYINSVLNEDQKLECLAHELSHIRKDHFYKDEEPIRDIEREATGAVIPFYQFEKLAIKVR